MDRLGHQLSTKNIFKFHTMRFSTIIIFNLVSALCFAQTNVYHPFESENATWSILNKNWATTGIDTNTYYYGLCAEGDTIIDGKEYLLIKNMLDGYCSYSVAGLIREDSATKKVYLNRLGLQFDGDTLLFDFGITLGQSVNHCFSFAHFDSSKVTQIDSIEIDDSYRKKINIICYTNGFVDSTYWIEGIGGVFGPCPLLADPNYFGYGITEPEQSKSHLICYKVNDSIKYQSSYLFYDCDYSINVDDHTPSTTIDVYPNPVFGDQVYIKGENDYEGSIYSITGLLIKKFPIGDFTTINIKDFDSGIYVLLVKNDLSHVATKLIVIARKN